MEEKSPRPGIEPGPPGWKPGILTPRPSGTGDHPFHFKNNNFCTLFYKSWTYGEVFFLCSKSLLMLISLFMFWCLSVVVYFDETKRLDLESNVGWRWKMEGKRKRAKGRREGPRIYLQLMRRVCPRGNFHKPMNVSFRPDGDIQMVLININYNLL